MLDKVAQYSGVCRSATLAEKLAHLLAIAAPIMGHKARRSEADALPWPPTCIFDTLQEMERLDEGKGNWAQTGVPCVGRSRERCHPPRA